MTKMNNSSYKDYLTYGLESLSKKFNIKAYKLASQEEWMGFERGRDLRIQIRWDNECIWEWITEKSFWIQLNSNKEDRIWMRNHADIKINACKNAVIKKKTTKQKMPKQNKPVATKKIGSTQDCFEKMKTQ
jgi:hypothetical protein